MASLLALVVDGDASLRAHLEDLLETLGIRTLGAATPADAEATARDRLVDLVIARPAGWIESCTTWPSRPVAVGVFADSASLKATASGWLDRGFDDLLALDWDEATQSLALKRCASWAEQRARDAGLRDGAREREGFGGLVGRSAALESIRERLQRLAPLAENLWIEGEPGVGKQWCARELHRLGAGTEHPFVVLEAADLEAPGWEDRWLSPGDDGGLPKLSIYLEQPGAFRAPAMDRLQRLMLKIEASKNSTFRLVSGSTVALETLVEQAAIPRALAGMLSAVRLTIPPLRSRAEDVGPLALHFIRLIEQVNCLDPLRLSAEALDQLEAYAWPGNVRELRHAIEHAAILADGLIELTQLPRAVRDGVGADDRDAGVDYSGRPFREAKGDVVARFERDYLTALMECERGNVTAAAREAGMLRSALQRLLRKYGLKSADFRRRQRGRAATATRASRTD